MISTAIKRVTPRMAADAISENPICLYPPKIVYGCASTEIDSVSVIDNETNKVFSLLRTISGGTLRDFLLSSPYLVLFYREIDHRVVRLSIFV